MSAKHKSFKKVWKPKLFNVHCFPNVTDFRTSFIKSQDEFKLSESFLP